MSKLIHSHYEGDIQIKGHDYNNIVIVYSYEPDSFYSFVECCYTNKGIKSALLKKRVENDLPIFLEEQARKDYDRRCEVAYQEHIDRMEYAGDMKCHSRMEDERAA